MTDMIAQDLQDMHEHRVQTALALIFTILIVLGCAVGCGALLAVIWNIGVLL